MSKTKYTIIASAGCKERIIALIREYYLTDQSVSLLEGEKPGQFLIQKGTKVVTTGRMVKMQGKRYLFGYYQKP